MTLATSLREKEVETAIMRVLSEKAKPVKVETMFEVLCKYPRYVVSPAIGTLIFAGKIAPDLHWETLQIKTAR